MKCNLKLFKNIKTIIKFLFSNNDKLNEEQIALKRKIWIVIISILSIIIVVVLAITLNNKKDNVKKTYPNSAKMEQEYGSQGKVVDFKSEDVMTLFAPFTYHGLEAPAEELYLKDVVKASDLSNDYRNRLAFAYYYTTTQYDSMFDKTLYFNDSDLKDENNWYDPDGSGYTFPKEELGHDSKKSEVSYNSNNVDKFLNVSYCKNNTLFYNDEKNTNAVYKTSKFDCCDEIDAINFKVMEEGNSDIDANENEEENSDEETSNEEKQEEKNDEGYFEEDTQEKNNNEDIIWNDSTSYDEEFRYLFSKTLEKNFYKFFGKGIKYSPASLHTRGIGSMYHSYDKEKDYYIGCHLGGDLTPYCYFVNPYKAIKYSDKLEIYAYVCVGVDKSCIIGYSESNKGSALYASLDDAKKLQNPLKTFDNNWVFDELQRIDFSLHGKKLHYYNLEGIKGRPTYRYTFVKEEGDFVFDRVEKVK